MTGVDLPRSLQSISVARAVAIFLLAGLLVLLSITAVLALSQRRDAVSEAIRDARTLTNLEAHDVVGPVLADDALVAGPAQDRLDQVIRSRVLGALIVRVKIWDATGTVVYSDNADLIGHRFPLPPEEMEALQTSQTSAEVSNLRDAENVAEAHFGKLLQVYLGVRTPTGQRLLFETYQPYDTINVASRRKWLGSLPALVGGLVLLYLVQAPLAYRMASRLRASQESREQLLVASLATSDRERSRIAADLHDGVVQGLAGASYTLAATASASRAAGQWQTAESMDAISQDLRRWLRELRSLIVTVTPPALHSQGLRSSLEDLASTLEGRGVQVEVAVGDLGSLPEQAEALVYRVAQEAVRNIIRHADAHHVQVSLHVEDGPEAAVRTLRLVVCDDGRGFDPAAVSRSRGSVGLELLTSVVSAQAGTLNVLSSPNDGTSVSLNLFVSRPAPAPNVAGSQSALPLPAAPRRVASPR